MIKEGFQFPDSDTHWTSNIAGYQDEVYMVAIAAMTAPFSCAIDAGAHVGIFTRRMMRDFKHVIAFEPDLRNYACLAVNTMIPPWNCSPIFGALGVTMGHGKTVVDHEPNSGARSFMRGSGDTPIYTIDALQLRPSLIKIDTQGSEEEILHGAAKTLSIWHPVLIVEYPTVGACRLLEKLSYRLVGRVNKDSVYAEE